MALPITQHTPLLSTAPQASPDDMTQVAQAGFASVMNNRPDFEGGPDQPTAESVGVAAQAHGMAFYDLPFSGADLSPALALAFARQVAQMPKPVLLYCRTGTRSSLLYRMAVELGFLEPQHLRYVELD